LSGNGEGFDRKQPFSPEAEASVLSAMLMSPDAVVEARSVLRPEYFFRIANRRIYRAIEGLSDVGKSIDVIVLSERLKDTGELEAAGGLAYLTELLDAVPSARYVLRHAAIVRDKAKLRQLIEAASEVIRDCYNGGGRSASEVLEEAEGRLADVIRDSDIGSGYRLIREAISGALDEIEEDSRAPDGVAGLPTGFPSLDRMLGGLRPGGLTILAGRPGMGKSAWAWKAAVAASRKAPVGVCSLEMSETELLKRGLSMEGRVNLRSEISQDGFRSLGEALGYLQDLPIWIDDKPQGTLADIRAKLRRLLLVSPVKLFIVDYLQLMEGNGENRNQEVSTISRGLKKLARECDLHILALSQLARKVELRKPPRPILSDLRDSGSIEQDADKVLFLWRPEYYFDDKTPDSQKDKWRARAEIIIGKQRNGPTGSMVLRYEAETTHFSELAGDTFL